MYTLDVHLDVGVGMSKWEVSGESAADGEVKVDADEA